MCKWKGYNLSTLFNAAEIETDLPGYICAIGRVITEALCPMQLSVRLPYLGIYVQVKNS